MRNCCNAAFLLLYVVSVGSPFIAYRCHPVCHSNVVERSLKLRRSFSLPHAAAAAAVRRLVHPARTDRNELITTVTITFTIIYRYRQSGVEVIYDLLGNVQESFEAISSCSLVSSLEGVEAGITSARDAVEGERLSRKGIPSPVRTSEAVIAAVQHSAAVQWLACRLRFVESRDSHTRAEGGSVDSTRRILPLRVLE